VQLPRSRFPVLTSIFLGYTDTSLHLDRPVLPANMKFSGPDLMVTKFQTDMIVVTKNLLTVETLERAATRLLHAWPMLPFRTSATVSA
jgi:hypothetical protein